jgi:hypothetical protein
MKPLFIKGITLGNGTNLLLLTMSDLMSSRLFPNGGVLPKYLIL